MSIKILKGGLKNPEKELTDSIKPPESTYESIKRNVSRIPLSILKPVAAVQDFYEYVTGDKEGGHFNTEQLERGYEKLTNAPKGYYKPQGTLEELGDMIVSDAPFLAFSALSGGLGALPGALARSAGANVGIKAAEESGFGPVGQIFGAVLGAKTPEKISSIVKSFSKNPGKSSKNLLKEVSTRARLNYNESKNLLKDVKADSRSLSSKVMPIYEEVSELNPKKRNLDLGKDIESLIDSIHNGKLDINKAKSLKKQFLNEAYSKNQEEYIKLYYENLANEIKDWIYGLESSHPKAISLYKEADEVWQIIKRQKKLENIINTSSDLKNIFKQSPLLWPTTGAAFAGKKAIIPASRAIRFWRQPEVQQAMMSALESVSTGAEKEAIASLHKIGSKAQEFNVYGEEGGPKVKVIKGGLKS